MCVPVKIKFGAQSLPTGRELPQTSLSMLELRSEILDSFLVSKHDPHPVKVQEIRGTGG